MVDTVQVAQTLPDARSQPPVIVLDGGMSNALEDRGHDLSDPLWTARLLKDDDAEIAAVHRTYYDAGASVATTASYQASIGGFMAGGMDAHEARDLVTRSVTLAREVRDGLTADGTSRLVAASVGPYGAVLADGSEYRGRYGLSHAQLRDFHLARLELLLAGEPDLLAVETIPDIDEAEVLVELLNEFAVPAWMSFSSDGLSTRAGQSLAEAFAVAASARDAVAVGVNCCTPSDVLPAVELAASITGLPVIAYPNSGEGWKASSRQWTGASAFDVSLVPAWVDAGAAYVGGCCRVGPSDIAAIARVLS